MSILRRRWLVVGCLWVLVGLLPAAGAERAPQATVLAANGRVEFQPAGVETWYAATTNQVLYAGDQLRTAERSRAMLRLRDQSILPIRERSQLRLLERPEGTWLRLLRGVVSYFHRDDPGRLEIEGAGINAAVRGTEFVFEIRDDETVVVTLYDGEVVLSRDAGTPLSMHSGDVATARPGEAPRKTAVVVAGDWSAVQWALHYPAILDPGELGWPSVPDPALAPSWEAYVRGNLPQALARYPSDRAPAGPEERVFLAALLLSAGAVDEAERWLEPVIDGGGVGRLAAAHRALIETVRRGAPWPEDGGESLATERLGRSYALQAAARLAEARDEARRAAAASPEFGFAWVRLAELEFSLGRRRDAEAALAKGVALTPENAEAHALTGFVLAAGNRIREAHDAFDRALAVDRSLGNAWLGRGLCRIRRGDLAGGRADLLVAAAAEPQRSLLRSYLGKAFAEDQPFRVANEPDRARHEFELARRLDPGDPTPWLYSALLNQDENRINDAIADLGESQARNDHRALYRSQLGLDQDRAVRSVNLARVFADAGFEDIGLREATRAVTADYANAAAHFFLANSYDALRDPRQINLRYETPWLGEYLVGNLLAPVGAGALSQTVARNEYSKLFEQDGPGLVTRTTWTSNGDWLEEAAQYGQFGNFAYALDAQYRSEVGQRPNNDLEQLALRATAKVQAGPDDHLLFQAGWYDAESGDVLQRYDRGAAIPGLRLKERHEPLALAGWHHEWNPGSHTLLLVSPWNAFQTYVNPSNTALTVVEDATGAVNSAFFWPVPLADYDTRATGVSVEGQQIWQAGPQTLAAGVRYQHGGFNTTANLDLGGFDPEVPGASAVDPRVERVSLYAYDQWELCRAVMITAGVVYDRLTEPVNYRTAPLTDGETTDDLVSPKLGLTTRPWRGGTLRGAYTRSLGGVSFDQSYRLEPVQVAGFTQAYRGLFPESITGSVAGQEMQVAGVAWDQDLPSRTWWTASAELLTSEAVRGQGAFLYTPDVSGATTVQDQDLEFSERTLAVTVGQLVGRDLALTVRYRLSEAEFDGEFPGLPAGLAAFPQQRERQRSVLNELSLGARYHHPTGFFASWETVWTRQSNHEDVGHLAGDDFWQHNVWLGWRFYRRRAEIAAGILNLSDQDYRLHPLNYHAEPYRDRTFAVSAEFHF